MRTEDDVTTDRAADRALVLGPGGYLGTAWTAGLAAGLREAGIDLAEADLTVGTSAGAIVAAVLTAGQDPARLATPTGAAPARRPDTALTGAVFALLGQGLDPAEARRRVGRLALQSADPEAEADLLRRRTALIATDTWPEQRLLITAVCAHNGEPALWDAACGVPLARAVAASSAFPGIEVPVTVDGRHYIDGALRAGTNADLAAGARTLVVIDPLAHRHPGTPTAPGALTLAPDPAAARLLDTPGPADPATWQAAYRAGHTQATPAAALLHEAWRPVTPR
ncbi:patatin-like phospholipase family protein [Streptomyces sp. SP17BM10]|uniref:patatin-like phospholipase family protein n=1 Tax=Streptomyces sp. SP17BM10 TaxID=3002530 RepID=UPI002E77F9D5|nr:patatin-like phospholipase family protein [Streptomyces sp. SP17BM10]MEE1781721.1 patatin-like phospholipase family protein [Streptomyces sp. SP17BM10]